MADLTVGAVSLRRQPRFRASRTLEWPLYAHRRGKDGWLNVWTFRLMMERHNG